MPNSQRTNTQKKSGNSPAKKRTTSAKKSTATRKRVVGSTKGRRPNDKSATTKRK